MAEPTITHVPMRDGARLVTELYLPDDGEPAPAIVMRTPYDRVRFHDDPERFVVEPNAVVRRAHDDRRRRLAVVGQVELGDKPCTVAHRHVRDRRLGHRRPILRKRGGGT